MIDKEVAIISIIFLFIILGVYLFFFSSSEVHEIGPVNCTTDPEQSVIMLPEPNTSNVYIEDAIVDSGAPLSFGSGYLSLGELSQLLWAGAGIEDRDDGTRVVHSAGDLYPLEVYVIPQHVSGANCGIYHYEPDGHKLVLVRQGSFSEDIQKAAYGSRIAGESGAAIVLTALPARTSKKFGDQGAERYINIEAGAITQNMVLEAAAVGISAYPVDSFSQDFVDIMLGVDGYKEKTVYMSLVGKKKE